VFVNTLLGAMHESTHYVPSRRALADILAFSGRRDPEQRRFTGTIMAHHRYSRILRDPELITRLAHGWGNYLFRISSVPFR
jgi:hypothetical protein